MTEVAGPVGELPLLLCVGVSGHRGALDEKVVAGVNEILDRLQALLSGDAVPVSFRVISSLAEGADRIVVREVLKRPGSSFGAVLPFQQDEYENDFAAASRVEFRDLLGRADSVSVLEPQARRERAYADAGKVMVERSDVLVAVWDGEPARGEGGTGDVVALAREKGLPVYWVQPVTGQWVEERVSELPYDEAADLAEYNSRRVGAAEFARRTARRHADLSGAIAAAGLEADSFGPLLDWHVPAFTRADCLADRYRRMHAVSGDTVYFLAALAVATVAAQILFASRTFALAWIEVGLLVALLSILAVARNRRLHERWLAYRLLAERLRASFFVACCAAEASRSSASEKIYPVVRTERWLKRAFAAVWAARPAVDSTAWDVPGAKTLVVEGWVDDQIGYFQRSLQKNGARLHKLARVAQGFFAVTLIAAASHASGVGDTESGPSQGGKLIALTTVVLPAVGVAFGGIRAQREYARNSERFASMVRHVTEARQALASAQSREELQRQVANLDAVMMEENRDWFVVMRFRDPELPA